MLVSYGKNEAFIGVLNARAVPHPLVELDIVAKVSEYGPLVIQLDGRKTGNFVTTGQETKLRLRSDGYIAQCTLEEAQLCLKAVVLTRKSEVLLADAELG